MKKITKHVLCVLIALVTVLAVSSIAGISGTVEAETNVTKVQTYVSPPMPGHKLDFDPKTPDSEPGYTIDGVRWLDGSGNVCPPYTVAELGKTYTVEIYVCTNSGYVFTPHGIFNGYINQEEIPAYRILGYAGDESRFLCLYADFKCTDPIVTIKNNGGTDAVETRGYTYYGGDPNYYHTLSANPGPSGKIFKLWKVINSDSGELLYELDTPYYKYSSGTPANITFEAVYESGKKISTIRAGGVTAPIVWVSPKYTATVDPNVGYEIWTDCPVEYVKNGVRWYDATAKYYLDPADSEYTFLEGRKYLVEVFVKAKDGYNFADLSGKSCTLNGVTGNISKTVPGYSPLLYQSVGVTYESKDITLEIHGPDGLVSSSLHAAGSIADITAPFADGKVFAGWVITSGRGRIDDASAFKTRFWLPGDGTSTVRLKALYKDAAEELRPLIDDILIDDVSVGVNPAPQNLIAGQEYDLRFKWSLPLKYYEAGYRLLVRVYIPDFGWHKLTVLPTKDSDSANFTIHDTVTGSAGSRPVYKLSLTLVDPEGRNSTSVLELNSITLQFHNIVIDKQPQDAAAANGQTVKTTVTARGNGLTYQWWFYDKQLGKFVESSDKDNTYNITMSSAIDGTKVYCVITDSKGNTATTNTVTLTASTPLKITKQPVGVNVVKGDNAVVSVTASGDGLKYEWYIKNKDATSFSKSSITAATYSVAMSDTVNGRQLYCKVTDKYGNSVQSDTVTMTLKTVVSITKQPVSTTAPNGTKLTVSVTATGDGLKYEWYYKNKGASNFERSSVSAASYSVTMSDTVNSRQLYCKVSDKYGNSVKSDTVTLTKGNAVKITKQPVGTTVPNGTKLTVSVTATGDGLKYEWYYKNKGASNFERSTVSTASYSVTMSDTVNGRQLYCKVSDKYGNSVKSDTVTLTMAAALKITKQPVGTTVPNGTKFTVSVTASGDGLKYEWYYKNKGGSNFERSTVSTASYSATMSDTIDGRQLYCKVSDKYGNSVKSDTITLTKGNAVKITKQPVGTTVPNGTKFTVSVTASGDGLKYEWYYKNKGVSNFERSTVSTASYSATMSDAIDGRQLYCKVSDKYGNSVKSDTITLTKGAALKITKQPVSVTAANGAKATVSVTASGDGLKYEWYIKNKGASSFGKSSITAATYSVTMSDNINGRQLYCKVIDKYGNSVKSDTVTMTMGAALKITKQPVSVSVAKGENAVVSVTASGDSLKYEWYIKNKGASSFGKSSITAATYSVAMSDNINGRQLYCKVIDKYGNSVKSDTVTMTMKSAEVPGGIEVIRLSGKGRCQTAVKISMEAFTKADNVVLASGDNYADALAGVPLAYKMNAPILLVQKHKLHADTLAEIQRLGAKNVYILGGAAAISDDVKTELESKGYKVERIKGKNRFATSLEIAKKLQELCGKPDEIFFAYSHNYPDALAVSGVAAAKGCPVVYVAKSGILDKDIAEFVKNSGAKKGTIIGGTAAIGEAAEGDIAKYGVKNVTRLSGKNRYATCVKINEAYADVLTGKSVCVATGTNFPDALAGGVFAAKTKSPLVLVGTSLANEHKSYLNSKDANKVYVFGGTGAVSDNVVSSIVDELKK